MNEGLPAKTLAQAGGDGMKIYECRIEPAGARFVVNYAYGRAGQPLNSGTGTNVPVALPKAERIFRELVKAQTAKGYAEVAGAVACNP